MSDRPKEAKKFFLKHIVRKVFLEDWALKLTALVITFALWFGVTGLSTPTTKRITVPLNFNIASNAQIVNVPQQEVVIEISGDKTAIGQINRSELVASVDLTETQPGDRVVLLSPDTVFVPLPKGIKLVEIAPSRIGVNLESVQEKEIEVKTETIGDPAPGYEVYSMSPIPAKIRVRGPVSVIDQLDHVQTDTIDIAGKKDGFTAKQVTVSSSNAKVAVLNTVVDVFFRIGERRIERSFSIPIAGPPRKMATVVIFGPRTLISKARADGFKVELEKNENGDETPQLILPPELLDLVEIRKLIVK